MAANPREPATGPITSDGHAYDPEPDPDQQDASLEEELAPYAASPATALVPTSYEALGVGDLIDFKSAFDPGDIERGSTLSARFPPDIVALADRLVHREDVPFGSKSDLLREGLWVLMRGLVDKLRLHDDDLLSLMAEQRVRNRARFAVARHDAWKEMTENLETQLLFWLDQGSPRACGDAIVDYWSEGKQIPRAAWREQVCGVLRDHPLVRASALAAEADGFLFPLALRTFAGGWK